MGGNKLTKFWQFVSLTLSFGFISYWHGFSLSVTLWSVLNWSMILAELFYKGYLLNLRSISRFVSFLRIFDLN